MRWLWALMVAASLVLLGYGAVRVEELKAQEDPHACGRENERERPEDKVACECYHEHDPCDKDRPETRACKSYCDKSKCGCCLP